MPRALGGGSNGEGVMHRSLIQAAAHAAILTASILGTVVAGVAAGFIETDLVANKIPLTDSNSVVHQALNADPNLLNPWGLVTSGTSPFWVADNGAGVSTLYNTAGTPRSLIVSIPAPGDPLGTSGAPTGVVFNIAFTTSSPPTFPITGVTSTNQPITASARFIFATEDGTIVGWNPAVNPPGFDASKVGTYGIIAVNSQPNVGGAVYKGLAIATNAGATFLYVTNFRTGTVEMYDTAFNRVLPDAFADPKLPRGYAPFNIVPIGGRLVVTFAVQNAAKHDDVAGMSHGIVDTFDLSGGTLQRLVQHGQLNSPWGVALAPAGFGALAGSLLIGNFGNGHIDAYNPTTGEFIDKMRNPNGQAIVIDGLWSLRAGDGNLNGGAANAVYFTAGPNGEKDGLFGVITPSP
jgi:uncharacterized protein (TIGR03118 family)